jgi:hypothetical protein
MQFNGASGRGPMVNYAATGRPPLRMRCPYCNAYDEHRVVKTLPKHYRWDDDATEMLKRISGKDISFREREKQCSKCGVEFVSVEVWKGFLGDVIKEAILARADAEKVTREREKLSIRLHELEARLKESSRIAAKKSSP